MEKREIKIKEGDILDTFQKAMQNDDALVARISANPILALDLLIIAQKMEDILFGYYPVEGE